MPKTWLEPKNIMGAWFLSFAIANYVGGKIATLTGGHGESEEALNLSDGLNKYLDVFSTIGFVLLGIALIIFFLNKPIKKLMHGVE